MSSNEEAATPAAASAAPNSNNKNFSRQASSASSNNSLTPSQTIRSSKKNNNRNRNNNNNQKKAPPSSTAQTKPLSAAAEGSVEAKPGNNESTTNDNANNNNNKKNSRNRRRNKANNKKVGNAESKPEGSKTGSAQPAAAGPTPASENKKKPKRRNRNNKRNKANNNNKRYPWRAQIPEGSVDPITLDPLDQLIYPPFALAAHEPYEPVPEWPVPESTTADNNNNQSIETEEERQRRILQEQWGHALQINKDQAGGGGVANEQDSNDGDDSSPKNRHYNLYDGRALAYYMVSQLQFIDPLNRRDLTRDELVNLDRYLRRHGFHNLNVTEAYDAKGVTLSTAGAVANTAAGRAQILQQEAAVLLQALFGGHSVSATRQPSQQQSTNNLAQQYQAYEQSQGQQRRNRRRQANSSEENDVGIYGDDDGGLLIIDDNMNPGLRGDAPEFVPDPSAASASGSLWSASHIAARHSHAARLQAQEFPSLSETAAPSTTGTSLNAEDKKESTRKNLPKASTLSKISGLVKQTTEEERQRQWEAREEMKRNAAMSNLTFGSNIALNQQQSQQPSMINPSTAMMLPSQPSEGQVERNRNLADALGVVPSTLRQTINTGWARPTDPLKEFGNELQATIYPDSLILQARERLGLVLKMEKKWKTFLEDDKAASLPLNPMDRGTRTFVHHYSDFWNLHTESFDPEPRRYIHCVKTRETMAPYPLLSDAVRQWQGPRLIPWTEQASQQTAGQVTNSRAIPPPPQRQPLQLKPASTGTAASTLNVASTLSGARLMTESEKASARFDGLAPQRPKLQLQPRTAPLEMPPFEPPPPENTFDVQETLRRQKERMEEKSRQEQEMLEAKRKALEAAFASDSEDDDVASRSASTDSDEWVEQEPVYQGYDE